jgi:hypothetical protein
MIDDSDMNIEDGVYFCVGVYCTVRDVYCISPRNSISGHRFV